MQHSFLYFGATEARYRLLDNLAVVGGKVVTNPCLPVGYNSSGTASDPHHPGVAFNGSSAWPLCLAAAQKLITDYQFEKLARHAPLMDGYGQHLRPVGGRSLSGC